MKKMYLFPSYFRKIGWIISLVTLLYVVIAAVFFPDMNDIIFKMPALLGMKNSNHIFSMERGFFIMAETSFMTTLFPVLMIIGFIFMTFSKEKNEDEYIAKIREQALVWSVLVSCVLIILSLLFIYGMDAIFIFWYDFLFFLLLFVIKFRIEIFKFKRTIKRNEE